MPDSAGYHFGDITRMTWAWLGPHTRSIRGKVDWLKFGKAVVLAMIAGQTVNFAVLMAALTNATTDEFLLEYLPAGAVVVVYVFEQIRRFFQAHLANFKALIRSTKMSDEVKKEKDTPPSDSASNNPRTKFLDAVAADKYKLYTPFSGFICNPEPEFALARGVDPVFVSIDNLNFNKASCMPFVFTDLLEPPGSKSTLGAHEPQGPQGFQGVVFGRGAEANYSGRFAYVAQSQILPAGIPSTTTYIGAPQALPTAQDISRPVTATDAVELFAVSVYDNMRADNTIDLKQFDPMLIVVIIQVIAEIVKFCAKKNVVDTLTHCKFHPHSLRARLTRLQVARKLPNQWGRSALDVSRLIIDNAIKELDTGSLSTFYPE